MVSISMKSADELRIRFSMAFSSIYFQSDCNKTVMHHIKTSVNSIYVFSDSVFGPIHWFPDL